MEFKVLDFRAASVLSGDMILRCDWEVVARRTALAPSRSNGWERRVAN